MVPSDTGMDGKFNGSGCVYFEKRYFSGPTKSNFRLLCKITVPRIKPNITAH